MAETGAWTLLAWQGIAFETPADWSLAAAAGDRKRGSLRVEDDFVTRAEVAWQRAPRKRSLDDIAAQVRRRFQRAARKRRETVTVEEASLKLKRRDYRLLRCRAAKAGSRDGAAGETLNLVVRCERCSRAVVATVYYRPRERARMTALAQRLFDSLHDHPKGERDVWSAYGVRLEVPSDYDLATSALRAGLVDLGFVRRDWQIDLVRSAMAEVQLRREGLAAWFVSAYARRIRQYATTTERTDFRGHAALRVTGATGVARTVLRPLRARQRVAVLAWHCQVTDKLFVFRLSGPGKVEEDFADLLESVVCH